MKFDRFAHETNLRRATGNRKSLSSFWPPLDDYRLICLDLAHAAPRLGPEFAAELESLRALIDAECYRSRRLGRTDRTPMADAAAIANCLGRIAVLLPNATDQRALRLRAAAVERGYDDASLAVLAELDEDIAVVAGKISTWYGKQTGGLPTAFCCVRDPRQQPAVAAVEQRLGDVAEYVRDLHAALRLGKAPAFAATQLCFMAGEGNRHPKHIAYFLPEDEGVKSSSFKKTYYFVNTHRALIDAISLPLARRLLDLGAPTPTSSAELEPVPTLGVLTHEIGHFVHRQGMTFAALNSSDRWASVTLQELAADVFGLLMLAEVLAPALQIAPADVVMYHLAESLRYVDRGLGFFPDSDGMALQLGYLASFGALAIEPGAEHLLAADPDVVIAGFRSLARVLADTLLAADVRRSIALYRTYGPTTCRWLEPLIATLRDEPQKSVEYLQELRTASPRPDLAPVE